MITITIEKAKEMVLDLARSEVGYHEKASNAQLDDPTANIGGANYTKYAAYIDSSPDFYNGKKNGYAWCDVFVDYLFVKCFGFDKGREMLCQPTDSAGAGCLYSANYYKEAKQFHRTDPQPGDQIFFSYSAGEYSHTGIVESISGDRITTIEGNSSDSVAKRTYDIDDYTIVGYGTPKWELVVEDWEKPWVVIEDGHIVNSSTWVQNENTATAVLYPTPSKENHDWTAPLLRYAPDDYYAAVCVLQGLLNCHNWDSGKIDGYFGAKTQAAVNRARTFNGMSATGVCDAALWQVLGIST